MENVKNITDITERLSKLEQKIKNIEYVIKEKIMVTEDFDFDSLLDDLDNVVEVKENKNIENIETIEEPEILETPELKIQAADELLDEINQQKEELKQKEKVIQDIKTESVTEKIDYEYADEARAFLKEYNNLEMEKRDIIQRMKELKTEFEDQGVDVKAVLKAQKEIIKEIKETPDEAHLVEEMKKLIKTDDVLMTATTVFAG